MSQLNPGEVEISLAGETRTLKPTLRALNIISSQYGGLARARELLVAQDMGATVFIIRHGLNLSDSQAKALPEQVYQTGLNADLLIPLIRFLGILGNGGKPQPDDPVDPRQGTEGDE